MHTPVNIAFQLVGKVAYLGAGGTLASVLP
jgi:hypothetical protein